MYRITEWFLLGRMKPGTLYKIIRIHCNTTTEIPNLGYICLSEGVRLLYPQQINFGT